MTELLMDLAPWTLMEISAIAVVVLVLIEHFFPVDFPAYIGYLCFALAMVFGVPLGFMPSVLAALGIWLVLLFLHNLWFIHFITNPRDVPTEQSSPSSNHVPWEWFTRPM
jgi:hypothetical protein